MIRKLPNVPSRLFARRYLPTLAPVSHFTLAQPRRRAGWRCLGCTQPPGNFPTTQSIVVGVPGVDCFRISLKCAVRQHGIVDSASEDAAGSGGCQCVGVFVAIQRDDGEAFADIADKEHCLFAADAAFSRHPRQRGVNLNQTVRSAAPSLPPQLNKRLLSSSVMSAV